MAPVDTTHRLRAFQEDATPFSKTSFTSGSVDSVSTVAYDMFNQRPASPTTSTSSDSLMANEYSCKSALPHKKYRPSTDCVYITETGVSDPYNSSSVPIYQTATFKQNGATEMGDYDYSRSGNPTRSAIEQHLAKIMNATKAYVVSSGMAALDIITRLVPSGHEIIAGDDLYGGSNRLLTHLRTTNNITVHHVDTTNVEAVKNAISSRTRLVLLETPTNPLMKICDITTISAAVHLACPDAIVVVDNTMMSPYLQKPLNLGADISYHSGTKYLSGHHDLMAGVIGIASPALAEKVFFMINATGCGLSPFDSFLLMRGVKTLAVRMDRQQANAIRIADFLEQRGLKVHFPSLLSHPQHQLHSKMARGPGAVLSFETGSVAISKTIVETAARNGCWSISVSFGCVNSLISMPCYMSHASIPAHVRAARCMPEDLIRLCIGIEDCDDLLEDLDAALQQAGLSSKVDS